MTIKETLTNKFGEQKRLFNIHDQLDDYIKTFILQLNENPDIVTLYSCEGISSENEVKKDGTMHSIWGYFGLNVSERYWDYFWTNIIPDLISKVDVKVSTNFYNDGIFLHAVSIESKVEFWETVFYVFEKHGLVKKPKGQICF